MPQLSLGLGLGLGLGDPRETQASPKGRMEEVLFLEQEVKKAGWAGEIAKIE
jgi:hypothetical protein